MRSRDWPAIERWLAAALLALCLLTLSSCGPKAAPTAASPSPKLPDKEESVDSLAPAVEPEPSSPAAESSVETAESPPAAEESSPPPESRERVLLFTPGGPLVIELALTIDGQPFDAALSRLTADALAAADTDGDGRPTWREVYESPKFKYGQFGNNPITPETTLKTFVETYDTNRDGQMNPGEVPKFLTRNMAGSSAFTLRATNQNRGDNVIESPLRRWLDEDQDGILSAEEIAAAPTRLRARDANDDDLLVPADFASPTAEIMAPEMPRRQGRRFGIEAAHLLGPKARWNSVLVALEELYGADGSLADRVTIAPELFRRLDTNENFTLEKQEVEALNSFEAHLQLAVEFDRATDPRQPAARLKLVSLAPQLAPRVKVATETELRVALVVAGAALEIYCVDAAPVADYMAQAEAVLAMLDADKNGYLEIGELPEGNEALVAPFAALDADGDGKVYADEIAAQLLRQQTALLSQIQARAGDNEDPLFAALDQDADGRLGSREISAAARRLRELDANGDGQLTIDEIPGSMALGLVRGDLRAEDGVSVAPPPLARGPRPDVPEWFARMDENGDGELSPREFLGNLEQFRALDANGDGFLSPAEAAAR